MLCISYCYDNVVFSKVNNIELINQKPETCFRKMHDENETTAHLFVINHFTSLKLLNDIVKTDGLH